MRVLRNCPRCGRLFQAGRAQVCRACQGETDDLYSRVRAYLRQQPSAGIEQVARATGTSRSEILDLLRSGRLQPGNGRTDTSCVACGRPSAGSKFCSACAAEFRRRMDKGGYGSYVRAEGEDG